ncbi:hypothetical protein Holit_03207 [Hollandina sp. SP2]
MKTRQEIFEAHYRRYQRAGKILDEMAGTTGLNRNHLAPLLTSYGKKQAVKGEARLSLKQREQGTGGERPPRYQDQAFVALVTLIGEEHGRPCGKLRSPLIRGMIDFLSHRKNLPTVSAMKPTACWSRSAAPR